ncbi:MAG: hypothetical protein CME62_05925 [Halobacteriovoraceae bacterium]|nr:hypothetical protein [Halobacteriovoraceae bacterium]|tara:strand:- start:109 stop:366 length:258 start_codon:yes stop_codon:yes gene_type:complete
MKLKLLALIILMSCAHHPPEKSLKKEVNDGDVSVQSILDISRSSYLKGCVEGIKHLTKKESKGIYFEFCRTKAKLHEKDIKDIIK